MKVNVLQLDRDCSVLGAGTQIVGDVSTSGDAQVGGRLLGNIRADGQVIVAEGGSVQGEIEAAEVVIGGEVTGHLRASRRAEILASASVHDPHPHRPGGRRAVRGAAHGAITTRVASWSRLTE